MIARISMIILLHKSRLRVLAALGRAGKGDSMQRKSRNVGKEFSGSCSWAIESKGQCICMRVLLPGNR